MTEQFTLVVGVNPGYDHQNDEPDPMQVAIDVWNGIVEAEGLISGVTLTAVATNGLALYPKAENGEDVIVFTGLRNPVFIADSSRWKEAVRRAADAMRRGLGQTTAYLTFQDVDFTYLRDA